MSRFFLFSSVFTVKYLAILKNCLFNRDNSVANQGPFMRIPQWKLGKPGRLRTTYIGRNK